MPSTQNLKGMKLMFSETVGIIRRLLRLAVIAIREEMADITVMTTMEGTPAIAQVNFATMAASFLTTG